MKSQEIRQQFISFFQERGHKFVPSSPVVPLDDPTLIFANAGMNQFKPYFLGSSVPDFARAVNSQKCIRVSGKHNDLEEVGHDSYHHTFFEMLGNWSFGDYYKKEAVAWAWELLTTVWGLPKDRLYATIYKDDDEADEVWRNVTDIDPSHIRRFGEKDNFWEMGETGPCGPCSEIHIDLTPDGRGGSLVNAGSPDVIELWNLVFIQYNRDASGKLAPLPAKHVDTGAGFERITRVLQGKPSNYDIDIFQDIIHGIADRTKKSYDDVVKPAFHVVADHVRMLTFAITDGAVPGNDGRGYVLRRILRRAAMYGRKLDMHEPFIGDVVKSVVASMGDAFPEIRERQSFVERVIRTEEENFNRTLDRGIEMFEDVARSLARSGRKVVEGSDVFRLYDTYGFPMDLTRIMAVERGLSIDEAGFEAAMAEQRARSREEGKKKFVAQTIEWTRVSDDRKTEFLGYDTLQAEARVIKFSRDASQVQFVFDRTPFYAESGGQVGDRGYIELNGARLEVWDTQKVNDEIVHFAEAPLDLDLAKYSTVKLYVSPEHREPTIRNHTATHLLHAALREILGDHVHQSGSVVEPDRLRFDFTHFERVSEDQLQQIEDRVNEKIRQNIVLQHHRQIPIDDARKMGALMFFGDKYGDRVNVVQFGEFSKEFCGGTHAPNTSFIRLFKIVSESSISAGVRRIEAVTGEAAESWVRLAMTTLSSLSRQLNCEPKDVTARMAELTESRKSLEKQVYDLRMELLSHRLIEIVGKPYDQEGISVIAGSLDVPAGIDPRDIGDQLRQKMGTSVALLVLRTEGSSTLLCAVADDLIKNRKLHAGHIVKTVAQHFGGSGGGRPHLATAGIKTAPDIGEIEKQLNSTLKNISGK